MQYHIDGNNELLEKKVRINKEKAADFRIDDGVITDFGFVTEDDVRLEAVKIKGRENLRIEPATEELYHLKRYGKKGITNWFALFFLAGFAYYMFYWMISVWQNRKQPREAERLPKMLNLEFLRVVFILGVVWCHCAMPFKIWQASWLGVEFFFILSGFLFYLTFNPQKILIDFMLGKIARFSPLILFGVVVSAGQ